MKSIVLDPFSGISGDMFLGAMVDVGVDFDAMVAETRKIDVLDKVKVTREAVDRGAIRATRVVVECPHEHAHRGLSAIRKIIEGSGVKAEVQRGAIETFTVLARAEAKVHGYDIEKVHFHEVGALDAIFDIVAAHVALDLLGQPDVYVNTISLGSGTAHSAHGDIPVPVPATVEILSGFPTRFTDVGAELVTPTGAALVASLAQPLGDDRVFTPDSVGYGAGSREGEGMPNVLRVMMGQVAERPAHVCVVTSTIDDMNPELYGPLMDRLYETGALDVYYTPVMMKKQRPGTEVTIIADDATLSAVTDALFTHSTTIGVRIQRESRLELERKRGTVTTEYGDIAVKIARRPGGDWTASPEFEACAAAATAAGVSTQQVFDAARSAWRDNAES